MCSSDLLGSAVQIAAALGIGFLFGDAAYLGYCNSFYTDAAALTGLLLTIAALLDLAIRGPSPWRLGGFLCGALLLILSKPQHAALALPMAVLLLLLLQSRAALVCGAVLLGAAAVSVRVSPVSSQAEPIFNLVFYKLTPHSADAARDLAALGMGPYQLRYVGMHAYLPGAPTTSLDFDQDLVRWTPTARVLRFYASHPARAVAILRQELNRNAALIQPAELGNYTEDSGRAPQTQAPGYWTARETRLFGRAPWLLPAWLGVLGIACLLVRSKPAWVCLTLIAMAGIEFAIATLMDGLDTPRHLLLFHALVELTYCFALTAAARAIYRSRSSS